jgi:Tfp pilus assembly protein PilF
MLKHLNRALRLHPANYQAHWLAARKLAALGRRGQAALEYRLAIEHGLNPNYDEIWRVVGDRILDAIPQRPAELLDVARYLVGAGRPIQADALCQRAVERASGAEPVLLARLAIAVQGQRVELVNRATDEVLAAAPGAQGYIAAAQALEQVGASARSDAAILAGIKAHADEPALALAGARLRLGRGELVGARALLKVVADGGFTLKDRQEAEELVAQIADRAGDPDAAVLARARARLIARRRQEATQLE